MKFTPRMNEAIKLASHLHRYHNRKDKNHTPYISHLFSVAMILREVTEDEDILIAGLMHDSLEDIPNYTYDNLVKDCGNRVAKIVKEITEPLNPNKKESKQMPWIKRKENYLISLRGGGVESAMVSISDKIHNTQSLINGIKEESDKFLLNFNSNIEDRVQFHEQVLLIVKEKLGDGHILVLTLDSKIKELKKLINEYKNI